MKSTDDSIFASFNKDGKDLCKRRDKINDEIKQLRQKYQDMINKLYIDISSHKYILFVFTKPLRTKFCNNGESGDTRGFFLLQAADFITMRNLEPGCEYLMKIFDDEEKVARNDLYLTFVRICKDYDGIYRPHREYCSSIPLMGFMPIMGDLVNDHRTGFGFRPKDPAYPKYDEFEEVVYFDDYESLSLFLETYDIDGGANGGEL